MYYYNGQQRSVCRDSWDMADAHVFCRSLELGYAVMIPNSDILGGSGNEVTLDCVYCSGNESSFFDCPGVGIACESSCNNSRDARVMCSGGNVCLTIWCNFGMNSQGDCHSLLQRTNDSESGTCVQYEVEAPMPTLSALKCLTSTEIELFGPLFGQILQCQKEQKIIYLASQSISSLEQQAFSGMESLRVLLLANNTIEHIPEGAFDGLQNLEFLDLSFNRIHSIPPKILTNMPRLKTLKIGNNNIIRLHSGAFSGLPSLENLYLDHNNITAIPDDIFSGSLFEIWINDNNLRELQYGAMRGLSSIKRIYLENNHIQKIDNGSFDGLQIQRITLENNNLVTINGLLHGLPELVMLNLSSNNIKHIGSGDFKDQTSLLLLDLRNNPITHIDPGVFDYAISLEYIVLLDIDLQSIHEDVLTGLTSLQAISTSDNRLCCLLERKEKNVTCARTTSTNPLDTCGRLFPSVVLRIAGWIIGLCSLVGNIIVLVLRFRHETKLSVQTLLIMNLAVADCLMGIYMIIITSADFHFGNSYFLNAPIWRESYLCKFSSFLAFLSSESSVFTLALMTVDRLICIKFPFGRYRFNVKSTATVMTVLWLLIFTLSVIPLVVPADVPGFYGLSDVCIGLPLHAESKETGLLQFKDSTSSKNIIAFSAEYIVTNRTVRPSWLYAIVTFIGVNMVLFIFILVCYVAMFLEVKKSTQSVGNATIRNREIKVARKMALIVGTDFACWMPIIVMGILTQSGLVVLPTSLYAWSVIFIIPINSSINPILYTFANYIEGRKKPKKNTPTKPNSEGGGTREKSATISNTSLTQVGSDDHKMNENKSIKTVTGSEM
ncbi:G-protein coupled receptor GRL101-like isoform X2 [Strongylocentrotus purpuratus]|uniref:G-protein coupled receptors family 1 profile domain-containing protein n=1 Tax=Strongylocentrotus purpuratus TaxID=7668 RepID=A0A7M7P8H2_STRPU|nr:G-protein coupled receptor GRL101-like isoform X2 [Strongylocentrotus purpuratus]